MEYFWAIDYVDENECELVIDDQLYASKEDAIEALVDREDRDLCEINQYSMADLEDDIYGGTLMQFGIDTNLRVHTWW
jgi:hypothetical protein